MFQTPTMQQRTSLLLFPILLLAGLCLLVTSALANDVLLGSPPVAPSLIRISQSAEVGSRTGLIPQTVFTPSFNLYLPLIRRDRPSAPVNPQNRQDSLNFYRDQYLASAGTALNWTGNVSSCVPGSTDQAFRDAVLRRLNYFRAMAGVPADIVFTDEFNRTSQAAALIMSANQQLSHFPPLTWVCYSADGATGASTSNLALGSFGWTAISGYMRDPGANNYPVGHRRYILYPQTQQMGTGDIPSGTGSPAANALHAYDSNYWGPRPPVRDDFVAWPPSGYVPYQVVFARWSISYPGADFSSASVSISSNGSVVPVSQAPVDNAYGENTLVWIPLGLSDGAIWPRPMTDTPYTVVISNVIVSSVPRTFQYNVVIFDPSS